jgi:hypothetical protein
VTVTGPTVVVGVKVVDAVPSAPIVFVIEVKPLLKMPFVVENKTDFPAVLPALLSHFAVMVADPPTSAIVCTDEVTVITSADTETDFDSDVAPKDVAVKATVPPVAGV